MSEESNLFNNLIYLVVGALIGGIIGFLSSYYNELKKEMRAEQKDKRRMLDYLVSLTYEIEMETERAYEFTKNYLAERKTDIQRLNYPLLDSFFTEFIRLSDDTDLNKNIGIIYNRFCLINFNIDNNKNVEAIKLAKGYLPEMHKNYNDIVEKLKEMCNKLEQEEPKDIKRISDDEIEKRKKNWKLGEFNMPSHEISAKNK